ncbi:MAG: hypothetical protein ACFFG0_55850 [Candidatus Thorarchaeota archaeon]
MSNCIKCNSILSDNVEVCPICGASQNSGDSSYVNNIDKKLSNTPNMLVSGPSEYDNSNNAMELERLIKRGDECFTSGKKWLGVKDRTRARKEFQRAFNYYDTALKIQPDNDKVRELRSKCLFKMA